MVDHKKDEVCLVHEASFKAMEAVLGQQIQTSSTQLLKDMSTIIATIKEEIKGSVFTAIAPIADKQNARAAVLSDHESRLRVLEKNDIKRTVMLSVIFVGIQLVGAAGTGVIVTELVKHLLAGK